MRRATNANSTASIHQRAGPEGIWLGGCTSKGVLDVEVLLEGSRIVSEKVAATADVAVRIGEVGEKSQVVPGIWGPKPLCAVLPQSRLTVLVRFVAGVMVRTEVPDCPAMMESAVGFAETVKSGVTTVMASGESKELDVAKLESPLKLAQICSDWNGMIVSDAFNAVLPFESVKFV